MKGRRFRHRLGFALAGVAAAWRREASFRTHALFAAAALAALLVLRPAPVWWALVTLTAALVCVLEMLNGVLEAVIDLLHPALHPEIKAAKDMAAGAVLLASGAALVVAAALVVDRAPALLADLGWRTG